jgi:hypothetical protein
MRLQRQWVLLSNSLIFLGLHFVIGQRESVAVTFTFGTNLATICFGLFSVYANSLLATSVLQFSSLIILLLTSALFRLNSRHELRRAHSSNDFIDLGLQQQNNLDVENYVSSIILHVMAGEDAYASNFC